LYHDLDIQQGLNGFRQWAMRKQKWWPMLGWSIN